MQTVSRLREDDVLRLGANEAATDGSCCSENTCAEVHFSVRECILFIDRGSWLRGAGFTKTSLIFHSPVTPCSQREPIVGVFPDTH